jgi:hypothetical protein
MHGETVKALTFSDYSGMQYTIATRVHGKGIQQSVKTYLQAATIP